MRLKIENAIAALVHSAMTVLLLSSSAAAMADNCVTNDYAESCWVRLNPASSKLFVFVHGIDGSGKKTWLGTIENEQISWPELIAQDGLFGDADILVSNYFSTKWRDSPGIRELTEGFVSELRENGALSKSESGADRYQNILFVAHSMGGLIVRQALIDDNDLARRTKALFTFATPTGGSQLANWLSKVSNSQSLNDMAREFGIEYRLNKKGEVEAASSTFLRDLRKGWRESGYLETIISYCAYETLPTYSLGLGKIVVFEKDTEFLCNRTSPMWGAHSEIVVPSDGWLGHSLLTSWYVNIFPDQTSKLDDEAKGDIVLVQCATESYTGDEYALMQSYINDIPDTHKSRVRFSKILPEDWRREYSQYLWKSGDSEPSALIIHYSCFQEEPENEAGWHERKHDNVEFLNSLKSTAVKVVFFSRAFVGGSSEEVVKSDGSPGYRFYTDVDESGVPDEKLMPIRDSFFASGCPRLFSVFSGIKTQEQRKEFETSFKDVVRRLRQSNC